LQYLYCSSSVSCGFVPAISKLQGSEEYEIAKNRSGIPACAGLLQNEKGKGKGKGKAALLLN
jgi:hypothetical protein